MWGREKPQGFPALNSLRDVERDGVDFQRKWGGEGRGFESGGKERISNTKDQES